MEEMVKFRKKETLDEYDIHTTSAFDNVVYVSLKKFYRRHYKEATGHTEEWVDERILTVFNNAYKVYHDLVDGAEISSLTVREKSLIMPNGELLEKELYYPQTAMPMLYFLLREYAENIEDNFRKDAIEKCMKNLHDVFVDDTEFFSMLEEAFSPENRFCGYRRFVIAADVESVLAALHEKLDAVQGGKDRVSVLLAFEKKGYLEPYFDEELEKTLPRYKDAFLEEFYSSKSIDEKNKIWRGMLPYYSGDRRKGLIERMNRRVY